MNLPQEENNSKGKLKAFWQKITNENNLPNELGIGLIICLIAIGFLIVILFNPNGVKKLTNRLSVTPFVTPVPTATPTPTPQPLPKGLQEYGISNKMNPQLRYLKISELDPIKGQSQKITLQVIDLEGKTISVEVKLITDHLSKTYPMTLSSGTNTNGEWSTTVNTDDTHSYIYTMEFMAKNDKGQKAMVPVAFR